MTVPNGPSDVATFATSSSTSVFLSADEQVASIVFPAGASSFTITDNNGLFLVSGAGVINNSGVIQNFVNHANQQLGSGALLYFTNQASAGNAIYTNYGAVFEAPTVGAVEFHDSASAASATFYNYAGFSGSGHTIFRDSSTAATAILYNYPAGPETLGFDHGYTEFHGTASASVATITCLGGNVRNPFGVATGGAVTFFDNSTAASAALNLEGGTAEQTAGGLLTFLGSSTAADATMVVGPGSNGGLGATVYFLQGSLGGAARIILRGTLDLSSHDKPGISTGSVVGGGTVILGANNLTVGASQQASTFSGLIEDGPVAGGSLSIVGGRLDLTNANTYTGGTSVSGATLLVDNATGSATGPGAIAVQNGTLAGQGIVSGAVTIGSGGGGGTVSFLSPGRRRMVRAIGNLTALQGVTFAAEGAYRCEVRKQAADRLTTDGLTINPGAQFYLLLLQHLPPPAGAVLTVINNTSALSIAGTFANLADGAVLQVERVKFQASYTGGDGNDLTLTVLP